MAEAKCLTYPVQLFEDVLNCVALDHTSKVLEVGIGMGQATAPFLNTGCSLTALDADEKMTAFCNEIFGENPHFSAVTSRFEEFEGENEVFDLVYSASAFHEVEQEAGYMKAFSLLKSGGVMCVTIYYGGDSGYEEKDALLPWLKTLDSDKYQVLATFFHNWRGEPPIPILIFKNSVI